MRKTLVFGLVILAGSATVTCTPQESPDQAAAAALPEQDAPQESPQGVRQERLKARYLTVRGLGLSGEGWTHNSVKQGHVDSATATDLFAVEDGRVCITFRAGEQEHQACMDDDSTDEGNLFRLHIDAPDVKEPHGAGQCQVKAIVIGFYDELWGRLAVEHQRYRCVQCGEILVCGSNPGC